MHRDAFECRWSRLRADETVLTRVIVVDDEVAGTIGSWGERSRPLHARVASDNVASRRVLEKCGFRVVATERNVAEARSAEIEEFVLRLEELAPTE